jgi:cardiolipin synthase A/B
MIEYWPHITVAATTDIVLTALVVRSAIMTRRDSSAAVAWCLVAILVPLLGAALYWIFGYSHLDRPAGKKRSHHLRFMAQHQSIAGGVPVAELPAVTATQSWNELGQMAIKVGAFPVMSGNAVTLFTETQRAFDALIEAVAAAQHHVHLEYFILHDDQTGRKLLDLLSRKAKAGVEVRLLYDAVGCVHLKRSALRPLVQAGGKVHAFLPIQVLRARVQVNLRNHRKLTVVDGRVGFTGGMNIGDEYLGKSAYFGYWRDTFLRLEGPAVSALQRVFVEDWDFGYSEPLDGPAYFPHLTQPGEDRVQIIESGPDQTINANRQMFFAGIVSARERLWIASPYFVPDGGLIDALRLAQLRGVDVRILCLKKPDHYVSFYAGRYYWEDMLAAGVKIYQYTKGMMHSKVMAVDGQWAIVGSANFDNRSLRLNFEVGCILHTPARVAEVEAAFAHDLEDAEQLDKVAFAKRPRYARVAENVCRLVSPIL